MALFQPESYLDQETAERLVIEEKTADLKLTAAKAAFWTELAFGISKVCEAVARRVQADLGKPK